MHFNVYDVFYSLNSHQHVSAAFAAIFRVTLLLKKIQRYKCDCLRRRRSITIKNNYNTIII